MYEKVSIQEKIRLSRKKLSLNRLFPVFLFMTHCLKIGFLWFSLLLSFIVECMRWFFKLSLFRNTFLELAYEGDKSPESKRATKRKAKITVDKRDKIVKLAKVRKKGLKKA